MSYDLDWLDNLSPETIQAIKADLNRNSVPTEQPRYTGPTVLLEDGRRVPGEYTILRKAIPDFRSVELDMGVEGFGERHEVRVPIYHNETGTIVHVEENTLDYHLGGYVGSPPKGAYSRIIKEA